MANRGRHRLTCLPWSHVLFTVSVRLESYHQRKVKSSWTFNYCRIWQHTLTNWSIHNHPLKKNKKPSLWRSCHPNAPVACFSAWHVMTKRPRCLNAICHVLWMHFVMFYGCKQNGCYLFTPSIRCVSYVLVPWSCVMIQSEMEEPSRDILWIVPLL